MKTKSKVFCQNSRQSVELLHDTCERSLKTSLRLIDTIVAQAEIIQALRLQLQLSEALRSSALLQSKPSK